MLFPNRIHAADYPKLFNRIFSREADQHPDMLAIRYVQPFVTLVETSNYYTPAMLFERMADLEPYLRACTIEGLSSLAFPGDASDPNATVATRVYAAIEKVSVVVVLLHPQRF